MPMIRPATRTMQAIAAVMEADQGASFRLHEKDVMPTLDDAYRGADEGHRSHLGASLMGAACGRKLWYSFRWATKASFDGRTLRLFNRGHLEEGRFVAMLRMIGMKVEQYDHNGKQFRINDHGGHYGGSGDGVALGCPDLPADQWCGLEFKTHNDASFKKLVTDGVRDTKWEHFVQMQQYMRKFGLPVFLYGAVNKNNDEVWFELVELDSALADQVIERAGKIIWMHEPPQKLPNASAGWFECKFCDHRRVCHLNAEPDKNCRTCAYSEPRDGGDAVWWCRHWDTSIPKPVQLVGCNNYQLKKM